MVSLTSANVQCEVYRHINVILDIGPPLLFFAAAVVADSLITDV